MVIYKKITHQTIKICFQTIRLTNKSFITFYQKLKVSKILINNQANESAVIISALETAGAIIIGKTSLVEFALGPHGINSSLPQTKNPWDLTRIPGGSSSGSACSVASSLCPIAIGSDTGGSIRMPASFCGVTGFKPSFNKLNTSGVFPLSWSLDTIGPIAKTAKDCSIFVEEICKHQIANKNKDPFNGSQLENEIVKNAVIVENLKQR